MAIDRMIEGLFRGRDLSANEVQFMCLIRMGILNSGDEAHHLGDDEAVGYVRERATEGKLSGFGVQFRTPFLMAFLGKSIGAAGPIPPRVQHTGGKGPLTQ